MYLNKLYTEPITFEPVEFKSGINFIFGKKEKSTQSKKSLNNIGKSTFLDILDFALLSDYNSRNKRLFAAYNKGYLKEKTVVLEFGINETNYIIKRSFDNPNKEILFSISNSKFAPYTKDEIKTKLCDLIFKKEDYEGHYTNIWLRKLIPFYLKIHKYKKEGFTDPIRYIKETNETELNQYHLFLMDIDNALSFNNFKYQSELKKIKPALDGIKSFFEEKYDLSLSDNQQAKISSNLNKLQREYEELDKTIKSFKLQENYIVDEKKADEYTAKIKQLWFENYSDKKQIEAFSNSLKFDDTKIQTKRVEQLYKEFNVLLAENIKKTLDETIKFKKDLIKSRKEFINEEVKELKKKIDKRKKEINELENKRKNIFDFLSNEEAIKDLSEAHYRLTEKKNELSELKGRVDIYRDLKIEKTEIEVEIKKLEVKVLDFEKEISSYKYELSKIIHETYNAIYPEYKDDNSIFDIGATDKQSKIAISFLENSSMFGKGKNNVRTLIYDISLLFNSMYKNLNAPRFLVHDGIFDSVDKAQFVHLYEYFETKTQQFELKGQRFQYILTYNQEGTLTEEFGNADKVSNEKIEDEAILTLTPSKKLFGNF
ncbi:MAG: DUF2326 domain-containing protein [Bacteroidetes bacterium]|jgi:uncharacterized protein YydD (DUF2326 family)|nr:DUF2326 domain-containing protein [Bacteroidota bacterium]MBT6686992.1 DUF2326 domain-containing protein [Bacteroidota bacterium]MBT7142406.1 DUF2326 domain-containing protein [Bacteroidota bacterium]MBT7490587.1 DUF2326 domain-containing protein [Bacteroidota bacterium]